MVACDNSVVSIPNLSEHLLVGAIHFWFLDKNLQINWGFDKLWPRLHATQFEVPHNRLDLFKCEF